MSSNPADAIMRTISVITPDGREVKMSMCASSQDALARNIMAQFPGYRLKNINEALDPAIASIPSSN